VENIVARGTNGGAERIKEQKHDMGYLETLTGKREKEQ